LEEQVAVDSNIAGFSRTALPGGPRADPAEHMQNDNHSHSHFIDLDQATGGAGRAAR
jgi:hypothetical protein